MYEAACCQHPLLAAAEVSSEKNRIPFSPEASQKRSDPKFRERRRTRQQRAKSPADRPFEMWLQLPRRPSMITGTLQRIGSAVCCVAA